MKIWKIDLRNKIAPANAILADDGSSVITFDNWGSIGTGSDVMVVYGKNGELLNSYSLKDISPIPISDYYQTVSSVWWRCDVKYIDINNIELKFCDKNKKSTVKQITLNN